MNGSCMRVLVACLSMLLLGVASVDAQGDGSESSSYDEHEHQFVLDLPSGWYAYDQTRQMTGSKSDEGIVIFSTVELSQVLGVTNSSKEREKQLDTMIKVDSGETPSFFVDRATAQRGMECDGFSRRAEKRVLKMLSRDRMWHGDANAVDPLSVLARQSIGGCEGLHLKGSSETGEGTIRVMDVHAVSDGETLYLFSMRANQPHFDRNADAYEAALASLKLTAADNSE